MRLFLGLRGRLVLALLAVTVVALAGATVALFTPLQQRLREDALSSLTSSAATARQAIDQLPPATIRRNSPALLDIARSLRHVGIEMVVLDPRGRPFVGSDPDLDLPLPFPQLRQTLRSRRRIRKVVGRGAESEALVVVSLRTTAGLLTLGVRKSLKDVQAAREVFLDGFERAALVSLAIAFVLGFVLATRLARRIRALRAAALRVAAEGPGGHVPDDGSRDEVGDLTREFAQMERRLGAQEEARKSFVATASHELRTPIAALRLRLGLLREDLGAAAPDLADAREQVTRADEQADRLARLASDLLDLSRLDAELPLRREPVPLVSLCRATIAEFDVSPGAPVELVVDDGDGGAGAMGDPDKIAQVVRILVDNARRYGPPGRPIRVLVAGATIAVENDGPAIPHDEREPIFERFRRGSGHETHPGFGLGLAIGRALARRMGGELALAPGGAPTRFELTLAPAPPPPA
jgi:signal transduction histidine kinase